MKPRRRRLRATMAFLLLSLGLSPAWANSSESESGDAGKRFAEMAEKASSDGRALAELYGMQEQYVNRALGEWRDGPERKKLQEASSLLQKNTEHINASLTMAAEAAAAMSTRLRQSGVLEKMTQLETAAKEAGARLAARWERERAAREREREQREREAGERAREQRR
jgi:hypothetical protein